MSQNGSCGGQSDLAVGVDFLRGGARPPVPLIVAHIDQHKSEFGVKPTCTTLAAAGVPIAPSTYHAARHRPPSPRTVRDETVNTAISRAHEGNYGVYGIRKVHAQLARDGGSDRWLGAPSPG